MSGSEMARTKEAVAAKMREKQAAGKTRQRLLEWPTSMIHGTNQSPTADAKKAADAAAKK